MKDNNFKEKAQQLASNLEMFQGLCRIIVRNQTPPQWKATIITVATEFDYRDGTKYTDYNQNISIPSGGSTYTESNDATRCVGEARTIIYVVVPGKNPVPIGAVSTCPAGECLLQDVLTLQPKASVTSSMLKSNNIADFLEFITTK